MRGLRQAFPNAEIQKTSSENRLKSESRKRVLRGASRIIPALGSGWFQTPDCIWVTGRRILVHRLPGLESQTRLK